VIEFWREWFRPAVSNQYVVLSIGIALGILVLYGLIRAGIYIHHFGFVNWLKATFKIDTESWRLIGILLFVAVAVALMYMRGAG
jgi:hypothetical protein